MSQSWSPSRSPSPISLPPHNPRGQTRLTSFYPRHFIRKPRNGSVITDHFFPSGPVADPGISVGDPGQSVHGSFFPRAPDTPPASAELESLQERYARLTRSPPAHQGIPKDNEGIETRKQILERRRKECAAEDVDVALAPVMKLRIPFSLYPAQYRRFRELFPRVNVDSGLHYTHHDHPVSHISTMVGIRQIQSRLPEGGLVLDLHGNPGGNENYNRYQERRSAGRRNAGAPTKVHTYVQMHGAADAVRRLTKWGPERGPDGTRRWATGGLQDVPAGKYNAFTGIHTLYYYKAQELCELFKHNKDAVGHFLVNYSPEQSGTLYGELKFSKSGGVTTQTSPNGEQYSHDDVDWFFQTNSYRRNGKSDGIAWTTHNVAGPLYVISIVYCPDGHATRVAYQAPSCPALLVEAGHKFFGMVLVGGRQVRLAISNKPLADHLRHFMTLRDRADPNVFKDLIVKARRCTSADLVSGSNQFDVEPGHLQDHIIYAYLVDAPGELELMDGIQHLKADCLLPLSKALKFEGDIKTQGIFRAIFNRLLKPTDLAPGLKAGLAAPECAQRDKENGSLLPIRRK